MTYHFVCKDCEKIYDIDKIQNACRFLTVLLKEHKGHSCFVYDEESRESRICYEEDNKSRISKEESLHYKHLDCFDYEKYKKEHKEVCVEKLKKLLNKEV